MKRHWPVLALGSVSMATAIGLGLWQIAGGPDLFPIPPFLALMGTVTLGLWQRLIQREGARWRAHRELYDTHRMFNIRAGLPLPKDDRKP